MGYNVTNNNMNIKHELLARHLTTFATENERGASGRRDGAFLDWGKWTNTKARTLRRVFVSCLWGGTGNYKLEI